MSGPFSSQVASSLYFDNHNKSYISENVQEAIEQASLIKNVLLVQKEPRVGQYTTIKQAVESIVDAGPEKHYMIRVAPGIYEEEEIVLPAYTSVCGAAINATIIKPLVADQHVFIMDTMTELSFLSLQGREDSAGSGKAAIYCENVGSFAQFHKLSIYDFDYGLINKASTIDSICYLEYVDINGNYSNAVWNKSENGFTATAQMENFYAYESLSTERTAVLSEGVNSQILLHTTGLIGAENGRGVVLRDGAQAVISASFFEGLGDSALKIENVGAACNAEMSASTFINCGLNLNILQPTATGYFEGYTDRSLVYIHPSSTFFLTNKDALIITVAKTGGDYSSIGAARASITDNSATKPYVISVGPGTFIEDTIVGGPHITIIGSGQGVTIVEVNNPDKHVFEMTPAFGVQYLTVRGATAPDRAAFYFQPTYLGEGAVIKKIDFDDNYHFIKFSCDAVTGVIDAQNLSTNQTVVTTCAFVMESLNGVEALFSLDNFKAVFINQPDELFRINGPGAFVVASDISTRAAPGLGQVARVFDGARLVARQFAAEGFNVGIGTENTGAAPSLQIVGSIFLCDTFDLWIMHPGTTGAISGIASFSRINTVSGLSLSLNIADPTDAGILLNGKIRYSDDDIVNAIDIAPLIVNTPTMGVIDGGTIVVNSGRTVNVGAGFGYCMSGSFPDHQLKRIAWATNSVTIPANTTSYVYFNPSNALESSTTLPATTSVVLVGKVTTDATSVLFIEQIKIDAHHYTNKLDRLMREGLGAIYASGSIVAESGTRGLQVTSGKYFFSQHVFTPAGGNPITWDAFHRSATVGVYTRTAAQTTVSNSLYDNGSGTLASIPATKYVKHLLAVVGGPSEQYVLIYGQTLFDSLAAAETGPLPQVPAFVADSFVKIASVIVLQGATAIQEIRSERPMLGFTATASSAVSSHSALSDLGNDDHTQYLLVNGDRAMAGALNMNNNNIINPGLVDGVDIPSHVSRHALNGADPLPTGTVSQMSAVGDTNSLGVQNAFTLVDHRHAHGAQTNPAHHAVVTTIANGFMSAADKTKLDGVAAGATANATNAQLRDRSTHTGTQSAATITGLATVATSGLKTDVGLGNVDNTSDLNKPISTATQAALDLKYNASNPNGYETPTELDSRDAANRDRANHTGTQVSSTISDFASTVLATVLTGISFLTSTAVIATDTVLVAIGKLQAQITGLASSKYDASNPNGYETPTQLNTRDTNNRARANHTGTQLASTVSDFSTAADARVAIHGNLTNNPHAVTKAQVGLGSVDNTSDLGKPVSTAQQTALDLKAPLASPTFTGTVSGITKAMVGLGNVDNTSDVNKPVSTATQTALNLKYDASNPNGYETPTQLNARDTANRARANHTGTQLAATISDLLSAVLGSALTGYTLGTNTVLAATDTILAAFGKVQAQINAKENSISAGTTSQYWRGDKTFQTLDKTAVGLANVDNTSDVNKPISTATQTALNGKENTITVGTTAQYWRGDKTFQTLNKTAVGLANVDNTSDISKPISTATQTALDLKYDASNPNGYETPAQLNTRDTNNRARANHTGTQLAATISDFSPAWATEFANVTQLRAAATRLLNSTSATLTNATELQFSVVSGKKYLLEAFILFQAVATGTGVAITVSAPAGVVSGVVMVPITNTDATNAMFTGSITTAGDVVIASGTGAANTTFMAKMQVVIAPSASGTVIPQFRTEVNGSQVSLEIGSFARLSIV